MAAQDIRRNVNGWVSTEIARQCLGEDFGWAVTWIPAPVQTPGGPILVAAWQALLTCRNPILGEGELYHIAQLGAPTPKEEDVRKQVADGVRQLRELAASKLSGLNGRAKAKTD